VQIYGGPTYALGVVAAAEAAGLDVLIGTDQEASIGTSAAAHLAAAMPRLPYPGDPVGPVLYTTDVVRERPRYEDGYLIVPDGPGLGMELEEEWHGPWGPVGAPLLAESLRRCRPHPCAGCDQPLPG